MQINALVAYQSGEGLKPYSFELQPLQSYDCLIKVLACGICHSDIHMVDGDWGNSRYPLVPGHEVIGEVVEVGNQVRHLKVGDRIGVGWQMSSCLQCSDCLKGNENLCDQSQALIVKGYGGFADYLTIDSRFAFPIPAGIDTEVAAPLLCGGITVYSGLRYAGMTSGQEIGIIGIGGLGHLAVQFASHLGNSVTVFTTSDDKAQFATQLGARHVVVVPPGASPPAAKQKLNIILSTVTIALDWEAYLQYLDSDGTLSLAGLTQKNKGDRKNRGFRRTRLTHHLCFWPRLGKSWLVGVASEPLNIPLFALLIKRRRVMASPIGGRGMMMEMLSIADRFGIKPIVETFPLQQANEAMQKVRDNKVRYRAVLTVS